MGITTKRVSAVVAAATLVACVGDSNAGGDGGGTDAVADSTTAPDVVDSGVADVVVEATPPCDPSKPFNAPVAVAGAVGEGVWFSNDERTVYTTAFFGDAGAGPEYLLGTQTRATISDAFGALTVLSINDDVQGNGVRASVTGDGLVILFASYRASASSSLQLYAANRSSTLANFSTPVLMANVNAQSWDTNLALSADGSELYFESQRLSSTGDVFHAIGSAKSSFNTPTKVDLGSGNATAPVISPDGLVLYFATIRASANTDIWVAKRSTISDGFGAPNPVTELNTTAAETPNWVSPDGCRLYYTKRNPGAVVMVATHP